MTDHFFTPGAEYDDATGYSAPETIRTFRCVAVAVLPDTGEPIAFGFMQHNRMPWFSTGMGIAGWRQGWNRTSPALETEPSEGLRALAEANEREKAVQAGEATLDQDAYLQGHARLDLDAALYKQLAAVIRNGIAAGQWKPGDALPSEAALEAQYEVSVATVRQALALLRAEGLITTRNGIGSFVAEVSGPGPKPWEPCVDCLTPLSCGEADELPCP